MDGQQNNGKNKGGRNFKKNPSIHRYVFRLTDEENSKFLSLFEASGADNKAHFVTSILFEKPIKTVKVDIAAMDYYMRLTTLYGQFRSVGVNYNQIVKLLYRNFSEKKAAAYLFKLEKQTAELAKLCREITQLTEEFETKYLIKNEKK
ncbi:conjugal transfer protein MobA [Flavobacterium eburneipallidum]|uniref:conjugal transfer protein MobA n=1 Tax=Flavobacterium eburneipallidum TaxID=3003263 RepID=UPI0022AC718D|nr:conjugal transfer protein MobA [Flavobacterium eburneipallidum]